MRKAEEILKELAFNKNAPESTKKAFLKNLQRAMVDSHKADVVPVSNGKLISTKICETPQREAQMCFDLGSFDYRPKKQTS